MHLPANYDEIEVESRIFFENVPENLRDALRRDRPLLRATWTTRHGHLRQFNGVDFQLKKTLGSFLVFGEEHIHEVFVSLESRTMDVYEMRRINCKDAKLAVCVENINYKETFDMNNGVVLNLFLNSSTGQNDCVLELEYENDKKINFGNLENAYEELVAAYGLTKNRRLDLTGRGLNTRVVHGFRPCEGKVAIKWDGISRTVEFHENFATVHSNGLVRAESIAFSRAVPRRLMDVLGKLLWVVERMDDGFFVVIDFRTGGHDMTTIERVRLLENLDGSGFWSRVRKVTQLKIYSQKWSRTASFEKEEEVFSVAERDLTNENGLGSDGFVVVSEDFCFKLKPNNATIDLTIFADGELGSSDGVLTKWFVDWGGCDNRFANSVHEFSVLQADLCLKWVRSRPDKGFKANSLKEIDRICRSVCRSDPSPKKTALSKTRGSVTRRSSPRTVTI